MRVRSQAMDSAPRFEEVEGEGGGWYVVCPICSPSDAARGWAHLAAVDVSGGDSRITVTHEPGTDGNRVEEEPSKPVGRGSSVVISFEGECLHVWQVAFSFHKGQTTVKLLRVGFPEMWRD